MMFHLFIPQEFATQAENIFRGSQRHAHLDKSYATLVAVIFEQIVRVANEHPKTPKEVVMMGRCYFLVLTIISEVLCLNGELLHYSVCHQTSCLKISKEYYKINLHFCRKAKNYCLRWPCLLSYFAENDIHLPWPRLTAFLYARLQTGRIMVRPSSDGTYYGMVMSVRPGLRPTLRPSGSPSARFPHFSHTCFDILHMTLF